MDFKDKVIIVTGASSGIGAATAIYLAKQFGDLAIIGRNRINLQRIGFYCEKFRGSPPLQIIADITDDDDVRRIVKEVIDRFGRVDVLVNNAAVLDMGGIKTTDMDSYDKILSTNLRAVYHLTMLTVPHLILTKGCVVNVSCINSTKPNALTLAYNISKAGLDHFTKCVALELAGDGVRVNSVNSGFVKTNLFKGSNLNEEQLEMFVQNVVGNTPLKRPIEGEEIAAMIAFLAGDNAKSITGSCFVIDGGNTLR